MSLKKYLFLMVFATILCWAAWAFVLFFVSPRGAGAIGLIFFYLSLFLGFLGLFSILGFIIRYLFKKQEFAYRQVKTSFRQGTMFALLLTGSLFLQSQRLLVWWNTLLFVFLLAVVEYYFLVEEEKRYGVPSTK
ncbi:MAG TPA: hypothetical protein P5267_02720 [Patescibacteria group bacterium]|nr:hypothetical protein [Patescibacteria group bacterium]